PLKSFRHVLPIIRHHHEKFDGSGYPDGLAGESVPLTARVLQIVDVFDALTTERPYKPALSREVSLAVLENEVRRGWWDARVFAEFRAMLDTQCPEDVELLPSNLSAVPPLEPSLATGS
ncbi:MAG: HD-GYP domain-containing protein, partial [Candidatus Acidiferrales bacterium]